VLLWGLVHAGLWPLGTKPPLATHALLVVSSVVTFGQSTSTCNTGVAGFFRYQMTFFTFKGDTSD